MIPEEIVQFIVEKIDSIAQLEALLLLRREQQAPWTAAALAQRLYISEKQTLDALERLRADGLVTVTTGELDTFHYEPVSRELRDLVDRTAAVYAKQLVPVTNLIHSKPKTRIQQFADAFRIRKDEK
jgi:hypothetical protein